MDVLKDKVVINQDNKLITVSSITRDSKLIAYLFSASWCKHAPSYLSKLKLVYNESKRRKSGLEIIFISLDTDNASMMKHFQSQGYWYALVYGDDTIGELCYRHNITFIPCLIVVKPDGTIVTKKGISEIDTLGIDVLVTWSY